MEAPFRGFFFRCCFYMISSVPQPSQNSARTSAHLVLGWREWVGLPRLGLPMIKAKLDTGARTSALHAFDLSTETDDQGHLWVQFGIHPLQKRLDVVVRCRAPVIDQRQVTDSGGHREQRYVIATDLALGAQSWPIELTLTNRDTMRFRMLLGRTALADRALVNASSAFVLGQPRDPASLYCAHTENPPACC